MSSKLWSFYKALIKNPRDIGAAVPSSHQLAKAIAEYVPNKKNHFVIELGPGTGVITKALLSRNISPSDLIIIEQSKDLVRSLSSQLSNLRIIRGDAIYLSDLLRDLQKPISAIVSSLPLLSMPESTSKIILKQIESLLCEGGYFIQYTYGNRDPWAKYFLHLKKIDSKKIWKNIPPARVFVYIKQ